MAFFRDRADAGRVLAQHLTEYANRNDVVILALPRGGVPVGYEVARALQAPMDIYLVRKLGAPGQEELAMGAIASGGVMVLNQQVVRMLNIPDRVIEQVAQKEREELLRREEAYHDDHPRLDVTGRVGILVDDGLATGASMQAAAASLKARRPRKIVVAVPVGAPDTCQRIERQVDDVVCAITPEPFYGVGQWYEHFEQMTDEEVREILSEADKVLPEQKERGS